MGRSTDAGDSEPGSNSSWAGGGPRAGATSGAGLVTPARSIDTQGGGELLTHPVFGAEVSPGLVDTYVVFHNGQHHEVVCVGDVAPGSGGETFESGNTAWPGSG